MTDFSWPLDNVTLSNDQVTLRTPSHDDADGLVEAARDEASKKFTRVPDDYTRQKAIEFIDGKAADPTTMMWSAELKGHPGRYAGNLEIRLVSTCAKTVALAFTTAPWARRKGVAQAACELAIDHARRAGVRRVEVLTLAQNTATRMLLQRMGFILEGTMQKARQHRGRKVDVALFARTIS